MTETLTGPCRVPATATLGPNRILNDAERGRTNRLLYFDAPLCGEVQTARSGSDSFPRTRRCRTGKSVHTPRRQGVGVLLSRGAQK